jgi:hypothetical protein
VPEGDRRRKIVPLLDGDADAAASAAKLEDKILAARDGNAGQTEDWSKDCYWLWKRSLFGYEMVRT